MLLHKPRLLEWNAYGLYLVLATALLFTRMPWIDEAWFAGPAISLIRDSLILDYGACMWTVNPPHAFLFEAYAILQSFWYTIGQIDILWGRALSVLSGLAVLVILGRCASLTGFNHKTGAIALLATGSNYFFLYSATQIRPDIIAVLFVSAALYLHISWKNNPSSLIPLFLQHTFFVIGVFLHLQAAFVVLVVWLYILGFERKNYSGRAAASAVMPYLLAGLVYGAYLAGNLEEFHLRMTAIFSGDMLGHRGGMFSAMHSYLTSGQLIKFLVAFMMVASIAAGLVIYYRASGRTQPQVELVYALGGYVSWLLTTTHIDDYHAVWLIFAIQLSALAILSLLSATPFRWTRNLHLTPVVVILLIGSIAGVVYAGVNSIRRPIDDYFSDLNNFTRVFDAKQNAIHGVRDIMWFYGFDKQLLCLSGRANHLKNRYFITNVRNKDTSEVTRQCGLAAQGKVFTIYNCATGQRESMARP